jgi:hypothetical protein
VGTHQEPRRGLCRLFHASVMAHGGCATTAVLCLYVRLSMRLLVPFTAAHDVVLQNDRRSCSMPTVIHVMFLGSEACVCVQRPFKGLTVFVTWCCRMSSVLLVCITLDQRMQRLQMISLSCTSTLHAGAVAFSLLWQHLRLANPGMWQIHEWWWLNCGLQSLAGVLYTQNAKA